VVQQALEGVDPLKVDQAVMAKLVEQVEVAATALATEVGTIAGREEASKIDLVRVRRVWSLAGSFVPGCEVSYLGMKCPPWV
jgi:hypothetical protein